MIRPPVPPPQHNEALPPFYCTFTPGIPELLDELNLSLLVSTDGAVQWAGPIRVAPPRPGTQP